MNIKRNIILSLECRKKADDPIMENALLSYANELCISAHRVYTGYHIDVAKRDSDKQRVKNGSTNKFKQSAAEINTSLLSNYIEVQEVFKKFEEQEVVPIPFKSEYMRQLSLYINVVNDSLWGEHDNKTIGLLLCYGGDKGGVSICAFKL